MSEPKPPAAAAPAASAPAVPGQAGATSSIADQIRLREQKAGLLRQKGGHPYGNAVAVPHGSGLVHARHGGQEAPELEAQHTETFGTELLDIPLSRWPATR